MSVARTKLIMQNRDPEMVAKLKDAVRPAFDSLIDSIAEVNDELKAAIPTPYRVDPKDRNAGEKWYDDYKGRRSAKAANVRLLGELVRTCQDIMNSTVMLVAEADDDGIDEQEEQRKALLAKARENLREAADDESTN